MSLPEGTEPGLASKFQQAVSNNNGFSQPTLPFALLGFTKFIGEFVPGGGPPAPQATPTKINLRNLVILDTNFLISQMLINI